MTQNLLPLSKEEMKSRGWDSVDILLVSGDAYVDHPSFGVALIGRLLESKGFKVGIIAQPRCDSPEDVEIFGRPRLFAAVTAGAVDSMLSHYTAFRKKRSDDAYTPGGKAGARPNRATIVYTGLIKRAFPGLPVVLGGIEASLRRQSHFDFWTNKLRKSVLLDSKATLIAYGMAERSILEIADYYKEASVAKPPNAIEPPCHIRGTTVIVPKEYVSPWTTRPLPSHKELINDRFLLVKATQEAEQHVHSGDYALIQEADGRFVLTNPPSPHLTTEELDEIYSLPFTKQPHPSYREKIPAAGMIQWSVTSHRGCSGGCSFCALASHQGRIIRSRSATSIKDEVSNMRDIKGFTGSVSDVGGPSANMWMAKCTTDHKQCRRTSCLYPTACPHYKDSQDESLQLLESCSKVKGVKNIRIASGIRHDLAIHSPKYYKAVIQKYIGGQLKLAPEHSVPKVLSLMRKPAFSVFTEFMKVYEAETAKAGKKQYVIPYLLTAFPGCTEQDMKALANWLKSRGWKPQQIQCFIPTPGTVATAMYYAKRDEKGNPIYVATSDSERLRLHYVLANLISSEGSYRRNPKGTSDRTLKPGQRARKSENPRRQKRSSQSTRNKRHHSAGDTKRAGR